MIIFLFIESEKNLSHYYPVQRSSIHTVRISLKKEEKKTDQTVLESTINNAIKFI